MSAPLVWVAGGCGGAGGSLVAAGLALLGADRATGLVLVDLDPVDGGHAAMLGTSRRRGADDLIAVGGELSAAHLRAAAYPHPSGAAVIAAPRRDAGVTDLAARLGAVPGRPPLVCDLGSGAAAVGRRPSEGRLVVVAPRDVAGMRAAAAALAALDPGRGPVTVVVNGGGRRPDMSARAVGRALGLPVDLELPRADREALRLGAGIVPEGRRRPLTDALSGLAAVLLAGRPVTT